MSEIVSLKEKYKDYFKIGAAVSDKTIHSHKELLIKHFNSITCENEMKYDSVCNEEGIYNFNKADEIRDFAVNNSMDLRGHTFMWHNQTPNYIFNNTNREELLSTLENHIYKIGNRYKDAIYCWDVVNESIEDKEDEIYRVSNWNRILGEGFMDDAFHIARKVLPNAKLFYNDYNETEDLKSKKIYEVVKSMIERGVPVDGIGMQMHMSLYYPTLDELKRSIELYASLGVRLHITEMDVSLFRFEDKTRLLSPSADLLEKQAKVYQEFFRTFREYKQHIDCVTLWGIADDVTWLDDFPVKNRKNWPLLFDVNHQPKEAFYRITDF